MRRPHPLAPLGSALLLAGVGALAQAQQPPSPPHPPTFQTEVSYVDVDASVTDAQGSFVAGLAKEDFELSEDGQRQRIELFSEVDIPVERPTRSLFMDRPAPVDTRSNREASAGRVYAIVLDDLHIAPLRTVETREAARGFIEKYFGANDVAAVVYTSGRTDASQEFTNDPQLLLAAIDKFSGQRLRDPVRDKIDSYYLGLLRQTSGAPASDAYEPAKFDRRQRASGVFDSLKNLSELLSMVRGRRKALLLFSEGFDSGTDAPGFASTSSSGLGVMSDVLRAAARANVNVYPIDPRGLAGMTTDAIESMEGAQAPLNLAVGSSEFFAELRASHETLRTLADETGGFAAVDTNNLDAAFARLVQANSHYYVLGYYPPGHPRDGHFHTIEVHVRNRELHVSARRGYASPKGKAPKDDKAVDNETSAALRDVLNGPIQQGGLTLTVHAAPFKSSGQVASVALAIELNGSRLQFSPQPDGLFADNVELALFSVNDEGKPLRGGRVELNLALAPETYQRVKAYGVRANQRVALGPGRYQVRIGARETGARRTGSVFYDLDVPDFTKESLMMSGLLLTSNISQLMPTLLPDRMMDARLLPGPATSRRSFVQNEALALYAEIYDNTDLKLPHTIEIVTRLVREDGRTVFTSQETQNSARVVGVSKQIPLKDVPAARYVLQVTTHDLGTIGGGNPVTRETLITVLPPPAE